VADCTTSQDEIEEMATRPYRELVGTFAWLALGTHPDIAFTTSSLACFGHNPGHVHWEAVKRVLRYLKGTNKQFLKLGASPQESLPSRMRRLVCSCRSELASSDQDPKLGNRPVLDRLI